MNKPNKIDWTDEILYFIIEHVKHAPFVWDNNHPNYGYKAKKAKFWSLLAEKVNTHHGFNLTTPIAKDALQKKWTNMKTYYLFEESKSRRVVTDAHYFDTTWRFRSKLAFLSQTLDQPPNQKKGVAACGTSLGQTPSENSHDLSEDDPLATHNCHTENMMIKTEEPSMEDSPEAKAIENDEDEPIKQEKKRRKESSVIESQAHRNANRSNYYHYGMTIAQDLDQLDADFKIDAKLEIMQIIAKYKREQYLNQTNS